MEWLSPFRERSRFLRGEATTPFGRTLATMTLRRA
jgi:hypothetical protein